jgi:nitroreductase/NAD-dependent dihydropyrimidine dehydrogenase PreA subunit
MSFIEINKSICIECRSCRAICPSCFTLIAERTAVRENVEKCIGCGHCVALCPTDAIVHKKLPSAERPPLPALDGIDAEAFFALVQRRRSHRHFSNKPVPKKIIETIIESCRYCPTGVNAQEVAVKIITTADRIREGAGRAVSHYVTTIERLEAESARITREGSPIPEALQTQLRRNSRYRRMGASFEKGWDPIFHNAPVVLIFHAPDQAPTPKDDCTIAAHTAVLHAELLGLGTCYIGLFTRAAAEQPGISDNLDIPQDNCIFSTMIMGYPKFTYLRVPPRPPIAATWE